MLKIHIVALLVMMTCCPKWLLISVNLLPPLLTAKTETECYSKTRPHDVCKEKSSVDIGRGGNVNGVLREPIRMRIVREKLKRKCGP